MHSLPTLICLFLLLASAPHPDFTAASPIGEAALRPKVDHSDLPDLPAGEDVAEGAVENEAFNELDEGDVSEDVLMPARFRRLPAYYNCVYDRNSKSLRCLASPQTIFLRH